MTKDQDPVRKTLAAPSNLFRRGLVYVLKPLFGEIRGRFQDGLNKPQDGLNEPQDGLKELQDSPIMTQVVSSLP